jgi:hypothetical protein
MQEHFSLGFSHSRDRAQAFGATKILIQKVSHPAAKAALTMPARNINCAEEKVLCRS